MAWVHRGTLDPWVTRPMFYRSRALLFVSLLTLLGQGCVFDESGLLPPDIHLDASLDSAAPDAAPPDGAPPDGALPDGALPDGAPPDGALPDGAPPDAGLDAGPDAQVQTCGNSIREGSEPCDGADLGTATCASLGGAGGTLACHTDCTFDMAQCWSCGNNIREGSEPCDGTDLGSAACDTLGFAAGVLSCASGCAFDTTYCYTCGDGVREAAEHCDGTDLDGATCLSKGYDGGLLACTSSCHYDESGCTTCGDGVAEPGEPCDGADLGGKSCLTMGYDNGTLGCTTVCSLDVSACTLCGDGAMEGTEACDDGAANSNTQPDACRTDCTLPRCGDNVCDTPDRGGACLPDCTTVVLWEDFEGAWPGSWVAGDNNDHWWTGRDYWGRVTNRYHSSSRSLWCAENGSNITGYDDNMDAYAVRAVDLSPYAGQTITLTLWIWVDTNESADWYSTLYSPDAGANWTTLETVTGNTGGWVQKTYNLSSQAGNASFVLGIYFHSNGDTSTDEGAYVDDIRITAVW